MAELISSLVSCQPSAETGRFGTEIAHPNEYPNT